MTLKVKRPTKKSCALLLEEPNRPATEAEIPFNPEFLSQIQDLAASGLTPSSALALITRLIAEIPEASKETMDRIKMLDKLLNTARAMMETRLKNEEAAAIGARLDEMEVSIEKLATEKAAETITVVEMWDGHEREKGFP